MKDINYTPEVCPHCNQSTTYLLPIDKGTVNILKKMAKFIAEKGINIVHPRKEMEGYLLSSNDVGNISRAKFHGLVAKVEGEKGNYCLTEKGMKFLNGYVIPKYAIVSKAESKLLGYFEGQKYNVSVHEFTGKDPYWEGINFDIVQGRTVYNLDQMR